MRPAYAGLSLFLFLVVMVLPAQADIYLKSEDGKFTVTNEPKDQSYIKVVDRSGEKSPQEADRIQEAVEYAAGEYQLPQSLIFSILRSYRGNKRGLLMPLPPGYMEEHGETIARQPRRNIRESVKFFQEMLRRYDGNMALTLAAYHKGPDAVDEVGGIPPDNRTKQFIQSVQDTFDQFETREAIIYTYRDENGTLHVVNIR